MPASTQGATDGRLGAHVLKPGNLVLVRLAQDPQHEYRGEFHGAMSWRGFTIEPATLWRLCRKNVTLYCRVEHHAEASRPVLIGYDRAFVLTAAQRIEITESGLIVTERTDANMFVEHTPECIASDASLQAARDAWEAAYPTHCRECGGCGVHPERGWFDCRANVGIPDETEPCVCTENGFCPRCGYYCAPAVDSGFEGPCPICGWTYYDYPPQVRQDECLCEIEAGNRAHERYLREMQEEGNPNGS